MNDPVEALRVKLLQTEQELRECRRAQAQLRDSEQRYRAIIEDQLDVICRYGPDFVITFVNEGACRASGRSSQELCGRSFLPLVHEADRERVVAIIRSLTPAQPVASFEDQVWMGDRLRHYHWTNRAIFDEAGQLLEYQGVGRDLTELKEIQRALARQNGELNWANRDLERLHREKDVLIAMVSHELRTPLVTGLGYLEMLLSGAFGPVSEKIVAKMSIAQKNLARLSQLVEDILDYQRLLLGPSRALKLQPVELPTLLEEARLELLERTGRTAPVLLELGPSLPLALADRDLLRRVIANLLDNAHAHGGAGSVIELAAVAEPGGELQVSVADDGAGISRELQERVFDLFVKGEEEGPGRGLGLGIVRAILTAHRARLELQSELGRGTRIRFWLKSAAEPSPAPVAAGSSGEKLGEL